VAAVNRRTIVVLIGGGTLVLDPWDAEVAAILYAWYPGMEGGRAVADLLLGDAEPGGRLPLALPHTQADLATVDWRARRVTYGRWWGQRMLDRDGVHAAYPLGFGLGYTTFALSGLKAGAVAGESFPVEVTVTNTGSRPGRHVVQCYAHLPGHERVVRALLGFRTVEVPAGESVTVTVPCSTRPLQRWDGTRLVIDYDEVTVEAASWSGDPQALSTVVAFAASI
jgi:beta-glucosidase